MFRPAAQPPPPPLAPPRPPPLAPPPPPAHAVAPLRDDELGALKSIAGE